jgi:hypothetical protein
MRTSRAKPEATSAAAKSPTRNSRLPESVRHPLPHWPPPRSASPIRRWRRDRRLTITGLVEPIQNLHRGQATAWGAP